MLDGIQGNAMELMAEIEPRGASMIELNVLRSPGSEEVTRIRFYRNQGYRRREWGRNDERAKYVNSVIVLDGSRASTLPNAEARPPERADVHIPPSEPLRLRVFVDRSIVEVFVNERQCVAQRVYPGRKDSVGVSLRAQGSPATLTSLNAWQMKNIYE